METNVVQKKRGFKVPHVYVIIFVLIVLVAIGTYFIPAGTYERYIEPETGRTLVDPDSFRYVESSPVSIFGVFRAIPLGMEKAAPIVFFILIVGGAFQMIQNTGVLDAVLPLVVASLKGKEKLLVPVTLIIFSITGFCFGLAEETIVFIPIGIALARALNYDALVGMSIIYTGAATGFIGGMLNLFTVGIAQSIAELPLFSGLGFRFIAYAFFLLSAVWWCMRYASRVQANLANSYVRELELEQKDQRITIDADQLPPVSGRHKVVLLVILLGFAYMIYGVFELEFYIVELTTAFLMMGVAAGLAGGFSPSELADSFVEGAKTIIFGSLVVGFARAILVVMEQAQIIDTVVAYLASVVGTFPGIFAALGMYVVQCIINLFIISGPGQAQTSMPIMVPLADLIGVTRQTAVLAFQYGDALTNSILPTAGGLMGALAIGKIPYEKWFKFMAPLTVIWFIIGAVFIVISVLVGLGPF
jgi:uncharacterized ion transporter superfamily protein YfcC